MKSHACPICKKDLVPGAPEWPFCSSRCRLIDLGNWLGNKYTIPGDEQQPSSSDDDQSKH